MKNKVMEETVAYINVGDSETQPLEDLKLRLDL